MILKIMVTGLDLVKPLMGNIQYIPRLTKKYISSGTSSQEGRRKWVEDCSPFMFIPVIFIYFYICVCTFQTGDLIA